MSRPRHSLLSNRQMMILVAAPGLFTVMIATVIDSDVFSFSLSTLTSIPSTFQYLTPCRVQPPYHEGHHSTYSQTSSSRCLILSEDYMQDTLSVIQSERPFAGLRGGEEVEGYHPAGLHASCPEHLEQG